MIKGKIGGDNEVLLESLGALGVVLSTFFLSMNLAFYGDLDPGYKAGHSSSDISDKHSHTPFVINNVRKLFNSAGDLEGINQGYTHILEGTELKNGKKAHFTYYIEEDGGPLWYDRVSEKTYVDSFSPPTPP